VLVAHAYNLSYSGRRQQEAHSLKPAQGNCSRDPISKSPSQKRSGEVAQGVGPEFKPWYHKKRNCDVAHHEPFFAFPTSSTFINVLFRTDRKYQLHT
jgi:hypothetical protein